MKKVNIFKLEDRVLFDAAGVADAVDAANQAASAEASAAQEQAQDSKEALKNAPPENPADAAANAQAQQNHSNPGEAADLDAAANKIVEGEIVPGQAPEQADAPADGADVDASAADTDGEAPDADHAAAESQGGDAGDSGDAGDAGDINDVPLGDIDDFINGGHDSDADHDGDAEHNAEQDSADADKPAPALDAVPAAANADAPGRELVIINSSVKDAQAIIDALGDNTDVLFLENGTDALDAINEYLDANGIKYDAIHIVSHGNAGYFVLNGEIIDAQSVANDPASWANIGKHLSDNGDIMIYGCNVAGNLDGQMLVSQIASLTGADVAASVDSTGVNGNWDLEYSIGVIDNQFLNVNDYRYSLASYQVGGNGGKDFDTQFNAALTAGDAGAEFLFTTNYTIERFNDKGEILSYTFTSDTNYTFSVSGGYTVTVGADITIECTDNGDVEHYVTFTGSGRNGGNFVFKGALTIDGNVELNGSFDASQATVTWGSYASLAKADGDNVSASYRFGDVVIGSGDNVDIGAGVNFNANSIENGGYLYNSGTVSVAEFTNSNYLSNAGNITARNTFTNTGNVYLDSTGRITAGTSFDHSGYISGKGSVVINGTWTGDGSVYMTGGSFEYRSSSFNTLNGINIYDGTYYDLSVGLTGQNLVWSNIAPSSGYSVSHGWSLKIDSGATLTFDGAVGFSDLNLYEGGWESYNYSDSSLVVYSKAFLESRPQGFTGNIGSLQLGTGSDSFADLVFGTTAVIHGAFLDASRVTGSLSLSGLSTTNPNCYLVVKESSPGSGQTDLTIRYDGSNGTSTTAGASVLVLKNADGNTLAYDVLEITGIVDVKSTITVNGRLVMNADSGLWIKSGGDFTLNGQISDRASASYQINSGGSLTFNLHGSSAGVVNANMRIYGNANLNLVDTQYFGNIQVSGGTLNITSIGNTTGTSYNGYVGSDLNGGTINIVGDNLTFYRDVTNALGWYVMNGYITSDNSQYTNSTGTQTATDLNNGWYDGKINVTSTGKINFNGAVVSTGEFTIHGGEVIFGNTSEAFVAVAAGNFTIKSGSKVTFGSDVYVSATYNSNRDTNFTVEGGNVTFSGDLWNWVRTWRGYWTGSGADKRAYGDLKIYFDGKDYWADLYTTDTEVRSTVNFKSGSNIIFADNTTLYNYGTFGIATVNVEAGAMASFYNIQNAAFNAWTPWSPGNRWKTTISWDSDLLSLYGYSSSPVTAEGVHPESAGDPINGATFNLIADKVTVKNDVLNTGGSAARYQYSGTTTHVPEAGFNVIGSENKFLGTFNNENNALLSISGGTGNQFNKIINGLHETGGSSAELRTKVLVTGTQNLGDFTNYAELDLTGAQKTSISLTNMGGETKLSGDSDGFVFEKLDIKGGSVTISAELGALGITTDINLSQGASLHIQAQNTITGDITNSGQINMNGAGSVLKGNLVNEASGSFNINEYMEVTGSVENKGKFLIDAPDMVLSSVFVNSGELSISKIVTFTQLTNEVSGKITFTGESVSAGGTVPGAEGTTFVNLVNKGTIDVTVKSILFTDGLNNSGTLTISTGSTGTRFKNMIDADGKIIFVNSGTLNINAASGAGEYMDLQNSGTVNIAADVSFGRVVNTSSITVSNLGNLQFYGALTNNGTIAGAGDVDIYYSAAGTGSFAMTGESTVTYHYYQDIADGKVAYIDSDGYWRIGGEIIMVGVGADQVKGDAYSNRPHYDPRYGWVIGDSTGKISDFNQYVDVTVQNGHWVIGGVDTGVDAVSNGLTPTLVQSATDPNVSSWWFDGKDTGISGNVSQNVYGGTVVNLTIAGDATLETTDGLVKGVTVVSNTVVSGAFVNNGIRIQVPGSITFNGTYADDAASSLDISSTGRVTFNVTTVDSATNRTMATVNGDVFNDGIIEVAANKAVTFLSTTAGEGEVRAANAMVAYDNSADTSVSQKVFRSSGYGELELRGSSKVIDSEVTTGSIVNESGVALNGGTLVVNLTASGAGDYLVGTESSIDFNNQSGKDYTIGGNIEIAADAFGVNFNGAEKAQIIVGGKLINNVLVNESEVRRTGVTASYVTFTEVENNGTFTVKDSGVQLGDFVQNAGAQLLFALQSGDVFAIDGVNSKITGNGGNITVQGGKVTVSSKIDAENGDNATDFQVNKGAILELAAAGQVLPYVIVDEGATLMISADAVLGTTTGAIGTSGLVLNGTLQTLGGEVTVYAYDTANHDDPTARIYVESGSKLTFVGEPDVYGFVYATIEIAGGELNSDSPRLTHAVMDEWIVIDSDDFTSNYEAGSKFIVKDGATLTVDGYLNGKGLPVEEGAFRLVGNGKLLVSVDLTVTDDVTVNAGSTITVNAGTDVIFNGAFASGGLITGGGNVAFNGSVTTAVTDDSGVVQTGTVNMTGDSVVTYGENAGNVLFGGIYATLVVNSVASVGDVTINKGLSGSGSVTFSGKTDGKAVVSGGTLSVTYEKEAKVVYGGEYGSLTFVGDHTVNAGSDEALNISVAGTFSILGGSAQAPVVLTLNNTNLTLEGDLVGTDSARIVAAGTQGTVTYNYSGYQTRDIYSGSYRELVINGNGTQNIANLTLTTSLSGTGSLSIGSSVSGTGRVVGGTLSVTYSENITTGFLGGDYKNLSMNGAGNKVINNNITVAGNTFAMGTFSGNGNLEFQGLVQGTATFGTDSTAYTGSVTYSAGSISGQTSQMVYGGNYSSLIFSGLAKTVDSNLTAGHLVTGSDVAIGNKAVVTFHQVTVDGSAPTIQIGAGSTLNITMTAGVTQPRLNNAGTLVVSSNGAYTFTGDTLTNDGVFRVTGNSEVTLDNIKMNNSLSSYAVDAGSTLNMTGFLATDAEGKEVPVVIAGITNNGNLNILGSNLTVTGAVTNTGTFTVDQGSTLTLEGNSTLDGTFILKRGNTLNIFGEVRINDLYTYGTIQVGSEDGRTGSLTLYKVSAGNEDPSSSTMIAYEGSTLKFDPYTVFQMIGGTVTVWQTPDHNPLQYDSNWTGFYNLVIETSWIIVNEDGYVIDVTTDGKYWIQGGAHVTVNGCGAGSQFRVDGDCELTFSITATGGNPDAAVQSVEVYAGGKVVIDSALSVTGSFTNSGDVTVNAAGTKFASFTNNAGASLTLNAALNAESKVENMAGGTITVNAAMTLDGNISNYGTISVTSAGVTVNGLVNTGIVQVGEAGVLNVETDLGGTLNVLENGQAVINVGTLTADVENAGTVTAGTGTLTFNGAVAGNGGTFSGDSLTFSGVTSGTAAVEAADVTYNGTDSQSVFGGTYGTLTLDGGLKTVTGKTEVTGVFTNNSGVQVDGSLTLNGLAGAGEYLVSQNGMLVFNGDGTVAGSVTNSGTVEVNALVSFGGGLSNLATGTLNLNATGLNVTADNAGVINVNAQNVTLSGSNSKTVNVADGGSLTLKMTDAAGANYTVAAGGVLNLDSASGTLFGRVDNAGTFNVISVVDSFVGGVSNSGTMVVESASNLANVTNSNLLILNGAAKLNGTVNDGNGTLDIKADGYKFDASKFTNDGLVKVSNGATVTADNIGANGSSGDYSVEANSTLNAGTDARFTGVLQNDGTISGNGNLITISGSTAGSGSLNNSSGEVVYNGADAQDIFSGEYGRLTVTGDGTKTLNGDITINTNGNISSSFVNNGAITSDGALIFDGKTSGNGTVNSTAETIYNQAAEHVYSGKYGKLTLSGVAKSIAGNVTADLLDNSARTLTVETSGVLTTGKLADDVNSQYNILGTWNFTGDAEILGSVNNSGVISTDSDLTFTGMTTGSGRIEISNTTGAVKYSGNADHEIYSGNYNDLTIDGTGNNTLSGDVKVNGTMSLDTRLNASGSLTLSGDTTGEGQLHSTGSVIYDRNGDQDIYNGSYKDITIDGNGVKSIVGNVTISGNAVQSGGAVLHASNGNVTYNGNGTQQVMNGTYDDLTLNGTGQKLFAAGSLTTVNGTFTATGSPSQLLYLDSTIPGRQWDVAAGNLNFNWVHISNSNLLSGGADLNGNNSLGSGNTGWKVFDSAGGIGDSFPSQNNLNFSSLAMLLGNELRAAELEELFYEEGFVFRRSGSLPKLDPNGDDIAAVLQSEVDFLGLETAYDTAIFDGADFSDADYSDLMSRADIFKDEVDEALSEMVAI
ncbi:DUF4347 domain-containing protein [Victivallis vadensis]|uniref:DUF4347 domain-containing protein n=1 Tax=Victivallis vadensis TaxID=172901 RepID=UPI003AF8A837